VITVGLDMYLRKKTYIGNKYRQPDQRVKVSVPKNQKDVFNPTKSIKSERITEITEEVAYWRKANAIHNWFVKNVQNGEDDCKEYDVSIEQLKELFELCDKIVKASKLIKGDITNGYSYNKGIKEPNIEKGKIIEDPTIAKQLLPTTEGFFFGGTDYDEYYLQEIINTRDMLDKILVEADNGGDFYYHASW
jgi:hypothetical protein